MKLEVGQKVSYPGQGVCCVEARSERSVAGGSICGFDLRVLNDNSSIFVPEPNIDSVGLRPVLTQKECKRLMTRLAEDFEAASNDWKSRSRDFMQKLQTGNIYDAMDVLKKLTYLSRVKRLSFREQTLLEKAKFLIVSEITYSAAPDKDLTEGDVLARIERACAKHITACQQDGASAAGH